VASFKRQGHDVDAAELAELRDKIKGTYDKQTDVRHGAARGWVDAIIDPADTRDMLILSLEVATRVTDPEPFRLGVFQV
jgi:acetyl-CoA carboxylase carboxyltransferase component